MKISASCSFDQMGNWIKRFFLYLLSHMTINLDMLCALVKTWVMDYVTCWLIVTRQQWYWLEPGDRGEDIVTIEFHKQ